MYVRYVSCGVTRSSPHSVYSRCFRATPRCPYARNAAIYLPSLCTRAYVYASTTFLRYLLHFPGLAGSALEAKLDGTEASAWWCTKKSNGYKRVWFSFSEASKPSCLLDELALFYDESTGR